MMLELVESSSGNVLQFIFMLGVVLGLECLHRALLLQAAVCGDLVADDSAALGPEKT